MFIPSPFNLSVQQLINRETGRHRFRYDFTTANTHGWKDTSVVTLERITYTRTHSRVVNIIYFLIDTEEALSRQTDAKINSIDPSRKANGSVRSPWWTSIHDMHLLRTEKRILLSLLSNRRGPLHFHRGESEWNASIFLIGASVFDARAYIYIYMYRYISNYSSWSASLAGAVKKHSRREYWI